jgi:hypothetical protein
MIPFDRELSRCRWPDGGCGRRILWAMTATGRRQALDAVPVDDGPVAAYRLDPRVWSARSLQAAGAPGPQPHEHRFAPHAMTCPKVRAARTGARAAAAAAAAPGEIPGLLPGARVVSLDAARRRRRAGGRRPG